jgi:AcrR family transcriptional regulator
MVASSDHMVASSPGRRSESAVPDPGRVGDQPGPPASASAAGGAQEAQRTPEESRLSPREIRRQQRLRVGREQILDAAEELFGRQGYRGASLQQVAKRCEFSIGALYLFIDSKEELLRAVLSRRTAALMERIRACVAGEGTGHEVLLDLARLQIEFHRAHPDFGRLSMQILSCSGGEPMPGFNEDIARGYDEAMTVQADLFARGQRDGTLRSGDPQCLSRLFSAMVTAYHGMDPKVAISSLGMPDEILLETVARAFAGPASR